MDKKNNKMFNYKKVKTAVVCGKKKCIYMKSKGTREYVKSKGEYVLLPVYVKRVAKIAAKKLVKNKNGKKKLRGGEKLSTLYKYKKTDVELDLSDIGSSIKELVLLSEIPEKDIKTVFVNKIETAPARRTFDLKTIPYKGVKIMIDGEYLTGEIYDNRAKAQIKAQNAAKNAEYYYIENGKFVNIKIKVGHELESNKRDIKRFYYFVFDIPIESITSPIYSVKKCKLEKYDGSFELKNACEREILYELYKDSYSNKLYINKIDEDNEIYVPSEVLKKFGPKLAISYEGVVTVDDSDLDKHYDVTKALNKSRRSSKSNKSIKSTLSKVFSKLTTRGSKVY